MFGDFALEGREGVEEADLAGEGDEGGVDVFGAGAGAFEFLGGEVGIAVLEDVVGGQAENGDGLEEGLVRGVEAGEEESELLLDQEVLLVEFGEVGEVGAEGGAPLGVGEGFVEDLLGGGGKHGDFLTGENGGKGAQIFNHGSLG